MESWISSLPEDAVVHLAVVLENDTPTLAFFLGRNKVVRNKVFRSQGVFLNATGIPQYDALYIEYNAMLCANSRRSAFQDVLDLLPSPWEEFFLPGLDSSSFPGNCLDQPIHSFNVLVEKDVPSPYADLELVRRKEGDCLSLLSSNTRYQVRRSYRKYELKGPVIAEVATNLDHAMDIYHEMVQLHHKTWQARGKPGAFSSRYFNHFHKELVRKRFGQGEIQLFRVRCGEETIGCLYNFVFRGRVYFYQSGINYLPDPHFKPGLITHLEAINYNAKMGSATYDFLAGDDRYKSVLATHHRRLIWVKIQKLQPKFWIETRLRNTKLRLQRRVTLKDKSRCVGGRG